VSELFAALADWSDVRLSALYRESFAIDALDSRLRTAAVDENQTIGITENLVQIADRHRSGFPLSVNLGRSVRLPRIFSASLSASSLSRMELP